MRECGRRFGALRLAIAMSAIAPAADVAGDTESRPGVVVVRVAPGSAADKAGLRPGDTIVSWSRPAAPPSNPQAAQGSVSSPFDLDQVDLDQVPRGPVTLVGSRGQEAASWTLPPVALGLSVRPHLEGRMLALYEEGKTLVDSGKASEGASRWQSAGEEIKGPGLELVRAWFIFQAAGIFARERAWAEADGAHERAAAAAEGTPPAAARILRRWANTLRQRDEWARADAACQRALALDAAQDPESLAVAQDLNGLGLNAQYSGNLKAADEAYARVLAIREKLAPGSVSMADALYNVALIARWRSDLDRAEASFRRVLAIHEKLLPDSVDVALDLQALGLVAADRGDLALAEDLARRVVAMEERLVPGSTELANGLNNVGAVLMQRGDAAGAEEYYRRSLELKEKLVPGTIVVANTLGNLGVAAVRRGDLAAAESHYRRALAIREKLAPRSLGLAEELNNLSELAVRRGDLAGAQEILERAAAMAEEVAPRSLFLAASLQALGEVARRRNDLGAAERHLRRALAIREELAAGSAAHAETLHEIGLVSRDAGNRAAAAPLLLQALDAFEAQRTRLGGTEEDRSAFAARYRAYYHDAMLTLVEQGEPARALHVLERSRARSLLALLAERDVAFAADIPHELVRERKLTDAEYDRVQAAIADLDAARDTEEIERLRGRLRDLRRQQEEIAARVRQSSPRLASLQYPQPLDLAGVRSALDPGTAFLAYSVGEAETILFLVQAGGAPGPGLSVFAVPAGEKGLRGKVEAFRDLIEREHDRAPTAAIRKRAAELYDLLVRPAEGILASSERLLVSADGPLHSLPFAALVREERAGTRSRGQYLVEWKPLAAVVSATVYAELQRARPRPAPTGQLVAFGDPRYPSVSGDRAEALHDLEARSAVARGVSFIPLPASRREVAAIAALFPGSARTFVGADATEERAKSVADEARYVHFAAHGVLDERFPLNSALALTIPAKPAEGQENGLLQAWEVFDQVRLDADLVALSACETALGKEMGGEGLLGLVRAFHYAGARSVLASLWAVADMSTSDLMKRFYGHLKAGRRQDEALRLAQMEMIRGRPSGARARRVSPYHWAAFQLSGSGR